MAFGGQGGFVCCPYCGDSVSVVRISPIHKKGWQWTGEFRNDGRKINSKLVDVGRFMCTACRNRTFTRKHGQTIREAMGSIE